MTAANTASTGAASSKTASREQVHGWIAARVAADAQMREAGERRTAEPEPPKAENLDEDNELSHELTVVLTRQHNQVRALLQHLQALPSHKTGGTPEDLRARKSIVDIATIHLAQHETAEEEYLWPAVRKALQDGDSAADEALRQEEEGTQTLAELGGLEPDRIRDAAGHRPAQRETAQRETEE